MSGSVDIKLRSGGKCTRLIVKAIRISHAKFYCNRVKPLYKKKWIFRTQNDMYQKKLPKFDCAKNNMYRIGSTPPLTLLLNL